MYFVIKKNQFKQHDTPQSAAQEARRLANKERTAFYVVEGKTIIAPKLTITEMPVILKQPQLRMLHAILLNELLSEDTPQQHGMPWSQELDELLTSMWLTGDYTVNGLAKIFKRSPFAIECRLERNGQCPFEV